MERETIKFTTPVGKQEVVLNAWITGREKRALRNVVLKSAKFSVDEEGQKVANAGFDNAVQMADDIENLGIEYVVVSVDGETENLVEKILDMRGEDYTAVKKKIDEVTKDDFLGEEKSGTQDGSTE